jgi:hypothetical protein
MHKLVAQKQLITWGYQAHKLLLIRGITHVLYAARNIQIMTVVGKLLSLSLFVPRLCLSFSTAFYELFTSVTGYFIPTIHRTYNNDNKNIHNFLIIN